MQERTEHNEITFTPTELRRLWSKVEKTATCWIWHGAVSRSGHGVFGFRNTSTSAHKAIYLSRPGAFVATGLSLDHLCRNRLCVNPEHLEPVTPQENSRRSPLVYKTHCSNGHEYSGDNLVFYPSMNQRQCRTCARERSKRSMQAYRDRAKAGQ